MSRPSVLLILPPYGDFTYPYHSVSYLAPALRRAGIDVEVIDLNIVWLRSILKSEQLGIWKREARSALDELNRLPQWGNEEQKLAIDCIRVMAAANFIDPALIIETLRTDAFYDYERYLDARVQYRLFEHILNWVYPAVEFYRAFERPADEGNAEALVSGALSCERFIGEAADLLKQRFAKRSFDVVGVSMSFSCHLRLGFASLAAAERVFPDAFRIAGGTAVTDIVSYRESDNTLAPFARCCDHLFVGEGDTMFASYVEWALGRQETCPAQAINPADVRDVEAAGEVPFHKISERHDTPDYSWCEWDLYLSPERGINYSPTRGCYWNKCTFCDYGMNRDTPTAPYRQARMERVIDDLVALEKSGIANVYMAADAVSPKFVRGIARGLSECGSKLKWSAQMKLEHYLTKEVVEELEIGGLVTSAFGLESGSAEVLEKMGKGRDQLNRTIHPVLDAFKDSTIGLQPMFFFGFPGETDADRQATVDLLNGNRDVFSVVTDCNSFVLTAGSLVARSPDTYGITNLRRPAGGDIQGSLSYEQVSGEPLARDLGYEGFSRQLDYFETFERPWVGGIDSFHTFLYLKRFGRGIVHQLSKLHAGDLSVRLRLPVDLPDSYFDLEQVFENVLITAWAEKRRGEDKVLEELGTEALDLALADAHRPLTRAARACDYRLELVD